MLIGLPRILVAAADAYIPACRLHLVCKRWAGLLAQCKELWSGLSYNSHSDSRSPEEQLSCFLQWLQTRGSFVTQLTFSMRTDSSQALLATFCCLPHLTQLTIDIYSDEIELDPVIAFLRNSVHLTSLCIVNSIEQDEPELIYLSPLNALKGLRSIDLSYGIRLEQQRQLCVLAPSLQHLDVHVNDWPDLSPVSSLVWLRHLSLAGQDGYALNSLEACLAPLSQLTYVCLGGFEELTTLGLSSVRHANLQSLVITDMRALPCLPHDTWRFPMLTGLRIHHDAFTRQTCEAYLGPLAIAAHASTSLRMFSMSSTGCMTFPSAVLLCTQLQSLSLDHFQFRQIPTQLANLRCLQSLYLSPTKDVPVHLPTDVVMSLTALTSLSVKWCCRLFAVGSYSMYDLIKLHPTLKHIDLEGATIGKHVCSRQPIIRSSI